MGGGDEILKEFNKLKGLVPEQLQSLHHCSCSWMLEGPLSLDLFHKSRNDIFVQVRYPVNRLGAQGNKAD